ncbi:hypothetical protein CQW23_12456 [Capsicum baccatum]|uniref:Ubiquitin-like protease family profile domain-containing protein n=1 Tax=Capsicum baccatum TaxID=33114 RepID=A0A2G2WSK5_CAPBA|nr:hypothetical protein CQW23_12456 [Capsicum baccatum]
MSDFLDQKVRTDWSMIEAYRDKIGNLFDVEYIEGISQQPIGILDCSLFLAAYAEYLSNGLQVPNDGLDAGLLCKRYVTLYENTKKQKLKNHAQAILKIHDDQSRIPWHWMKNNFSILILSSLHLQVPHICPPSSVSPELQQLLERKEL